MKRLLGLVSCCAALGAADPPTRVRVEYAAPEPCPDAATFTQLVLARSSRIAAARPGELARVFDVRIDRTGDRFVGSVTLTDEGGARRRREVPGATCEDVASALSLVVALAVDPELPSTSAPASASTAPAPPAPSASATSATAAPGAALPREPPPVEPAASSPAPALHPAPYTTRFGGALGALWGVAPGTRPAPGLWLDSEREGDHPLALRLALTGTVSSEISASSGSARAYWLALRADVCPLVVPAGISRWLACADVQAGLLHLARVDSSEQATRGWVAPGALVRGVFSFGDLRLELAGGPGFPLLRQRYLLTSLTGREEVLRVPAVTGFAEIGVGTAW